MDEFLTNFHFLRPWWLAAALPSGIILWLIAAQSDSRRAWNNIISRHLLGHLLIRESGKIRLRPWHFLVAVWVITIIALAGPAWQIEPSPFAEDQSALFIALKIAPSMMADDIQPSRLKRAIQKIKDLLELRQGTANGLIAYSGSAHLVMPLTRDITIVETFAAELSPQIMPSEGDAVAEAILMAYERFKISGLKGSVLVITDSMIEDQLRDVMENETHNRFPVHVLGVASENPGGTVSAPALDRSSLSKAARSLNGNLFVVTTDEQDVKSIASRVEKDLATLVSPDSGERWKDFGFWLVPIIACLVLMWFRRGWVMRFE